MDLQIIGVFALGVTFGATLGMVLARYFFDSTLRRLGVDPAGEREERWYGHLFR